MQPPSAREDNTPRIIAVIDWASASVPGTVLLHPSHPGPHWVLTAAPWNRYLYPYLLIRTLSKVLSFSQVQSGSQDSTPRLSWTSKLRISAIEANLKTVRGLVATPRRRSRVALNISLKRPSPRSFPGNTKITDSFLVNNCLNTRAGHYPCPVMETSL